MRIGNTLYAKDGFQLVKFGDWHFEFCDPDGERHAVRTLIAIRERENGDIYGFPYHQLLGVTKNRIEDLFIYFVGEIRGS